VNEEQARSLKVGDRVEWRSAVPNAERVQGTVSGFYEDGYWVMFDDGDENRFEFVHSSTIRRAVG
jgi:hypothetical protein